MRATVFAALFCGSALFAQPGTLDPNFGDGGITITSLNSWSDIVTDLLIQPDGKIIAVCAHSVSSEWKVALVRYHTNGIVDSTFGTNGVVISDFGGAMEFGYSGALTSTGKILVAGSSDERMMLARYLDDGTPDIGFDDDGVLIDTTWESPSGFNMTQQPDGRILMCGKRNEGNGIRVSVRRLHDDGTIDTSFDGDGYTMTDLPGVNESPASVVVQPDGKIVVAGSINSSEGFAMVRYDADGTLDNGFNSTGIWTYVTPGAWNQSLSCVIVRSDGKLLGVGSTSALESQTAMVCLNADGTPDATFDGDGFLYDSPVQQASWVEVLEQSDGKLLAFGSIADQPGFLVARYLSDGTLDSDFGSGGWTVTDMGGSAIISDGALMNDGRILAAGFTIPGTYEDLAFACYQNDVGGAAVEDLDMSRMAITAYPNPTHGVVHLQLSGSECRMLNGEVLDGQGRIVRTWSAQRMSGTGDYAVDLRDLSPGIYALRCAWPGGGATTSVVKY